MLAGEYAREALKRGLALEARLGTNPYKFGMVGSTDSHTGLATAQEDNFFGKHSGYEPSPGRMEHEFFSNDKGTIMGWGQVSSGLAAVWAPENTRESIFDAMERKEVYGTTGSRMFVRFFGGWDFTKKDIESRSPAFVGYDKGVPMGGDLSKRSANQSPSFMVIALRDPIGGSLDRIQIVKGWLKADGSTHEQVYDVVWSGDRKPGAHGKLPPVGNTVDAKTANFTNTIGASELATVWTDPSFDAKQKAFYYARAGDSDAALDHLRCLPFRYPDSRRGARVNPGAGIHLADLVHAVATARERSSHEHTARAFGSFSVVGAGLFVLFGPADQAGRSPLDQRIVVGTGHIERLAAVFEKTWQRPPTGDELKGLIDGFVLEEIYYRKALAMGIDRDDTIIRRRLRQKLEFLTDDVSSAIEPTDAELAGYLAENQERFRSPATYTFRQVYIHPEKHGDQTDAYVAEQLELLRSGQAHGGDATLLPESIDQDARQTVDGTFGKGFSEELDKLKIGTWQGPIRSGFGIHLIRLAGRTEGRVPELAEIRSVVQREWSHEKRMTNRQKMNERFLEDYEVIIEWPEQKVAAQVSGDPGPS